MGKSPDTREFCFCALLNAATVVFVMLIRLSSVGPFTLCELDLNGCPFAQHTLHSLLPLSNSCKSSVYFLQELQGKVLLRSPISVVPHADQGPPTLLERFL